LQVRKIRKAFPGVQALDKVSLVLHAGEVLAVVGENGAGKSTLMKILAGIYTADSGEILFDGQPVTIRHVTDAMAVGISLIRQEVDLADNLNAAANIFLGRELLCGGPGRFLRRRAMQRAAAALMAQVGLDCPASLPVGSLSPSKKQLVEIARALSLNVRILVMDEPTSSLTQRETDKLYEVIRSLKNKGVAIVYVSHRLAEVEHIADRVVVLRDGRNVGELERPEPNARGESPGASRLEPISHQAMVRLMVGRDPGQFFKRQHTPSLEHPRLELQRVRCGGIHGVPGGHSAPISFAVHAGEILGLAGLVGAGRTELAESLFGLRPSLSGQLFLDGRLVRFRSPAQAIAAGLALVPEDRRQHGLILQDTVRRNIALPNLDHLSRLAFIAKVRERELAERQRQQLRIRCPSVQQPVGLLSGGNQQKVVLGKWLARKPRVLIVDEPTRGVDVGSKSEIYGVLDELARAGSAVLMISSDLEEILGISDRVAVLHQGRLTGILPRMAFNQEAIMHLATGGKDPS
jgi:ribose transport system ATP-binding protein